MPSVFFKTDKVDVKVNDKLNTSESREKYKCIKTAVKGVVQDDQTKRRIGVHGKDAK